MLNCYRRARTTVTLASALCRALNCATVQYWTTTTTTGGRLRPVAALLASRTRILYVCRKLPVDLHGASWSRWQIERALFRTALGLATIRPRTRSNESSRGVVVAKTMHRDSSAQSSQHYRFLTPTKSRRCGVINVRRCDRIAGEQFRSVR